MRDNYLRISFVLFNLLLAFYLTFNAFIAWNEAPIVTSGKYNLDFDSEIKALGFFK